MGPQELMGSDVYDTQGERVGRVGNVYLSEESHQPEWVTVQTGLFGHRETFVPLAGAQEATDGLHVKWAKDKIKDAPRIDADGRLSPQDSMGLYDYYGMPIQRDGRSGTRTDGRTGGRTDNRAGNKAGDQSGDMTMTRSEEQLKVGTQRVETGRVRLVKHVVTEEQQITVPVTHEEVRIERRPVDPRNAGKAKIGEDQQEIVLHEDQPVVAKESVPVEQVTMHTKAVTEQQQVRDKVRKERIDVEDNNKRK
jgi:uncharacterized protein (TIGR02271 family)